jgi:steroid 5-alpha reductase family enzyme
MLGLMVVQAPVSAVLALAVLIAAHAPGPLGLTDLLAAAILAVAIGGERLADVQLTRFKARPDSHGRVCDEGLWAWSRHPNYFFEWIGWLAYPVAALPYGFERPWFWTALVAPVLMYLLLTRVSGVPPLERAMLASRGDAYRRYQARVPAFFPRPPSGAHS